MTNPTTRPLTHPVTTARLTLHPVDVAGARRILERDPAPDDRWAGDYPFDGDLRALAAYLAASEHCGEQRPFGYYQVRRRSDGRAVGGIGFKGPPSDRLVEVGYGLVPSARGAGYAAEALVALLAAVTGHGVTRVRADTTVDNLASRRTLERAGFVRVPDDGEALQYEWVSVPSS